MPEDGERPESIGIFISHRVKDDQELARKIRDKLTILGRDYFHVYVCDKIPGSVDWQDWIESHICESEILLFLFTDEDADLRWCLYEAGVFRGARHETKGHLICLKSSEIGQPPAPLSRLQYYESSKHGIEQFLETLLVGGTFTNGKQVNDKIHDEYKAEFNRAVTEISELFPASRISVEYYVKRLSIGPLMSTEDGETRILEGSEIDMNDVTKNLLGIARRKIKWDDLFMYFHSKEEKSWVDEMVEIIAELQTGVRQPKQLLRPFISGGNASVIPVISRVESMELKPNRIYIIFVEEPNEKPYDELDPNMVKAPQPFATVVKLLNIARRARWNILDRYIEELVLPIHSDADRSAMYDKIENSFVRLENEWEEELARYAGQAQTIFPDVPGEKIEAAWRGWWKGRANFQKAREEKDLEGVIDALDEIQDSNKQFMIMACERYLSLLKSIEPVSGPKIGTL